MAPLVCLVQTKRLIAASHEGSEPAGGRSDGGEVWDEGIFIYEHERWSCVSEPGPQTVHTAIQGAFQSEAGLGMKLWNIYIYRLGAPHRLVLFALEKTLDISHSLVPQSPARLSCGDALTCRLSENVCCEANTVFVIAVVSFLCPSVGDPSQDPTLGFEGAVVHSWPRLRMLFLN